MAQAENRISLYKLPRVRVRDALRQVLAGYERHGWSDEDICRHLADFDRALADYQTCVSCQAKQIETGSGRIAVRDCRSSLGQGRYLGLSASGCAMYGWPVFAAIECGGPQRWVSRTAERMRVGRNWPQEQPSAAQAQPAKAVSDLDAVEQWALRFGAVNLETGELSNASAGRDEW